MCFLFLCSFKDILSVILLYFSAPVKPSYGLVCHDSRVVSLCFVQIMFFLSSILLSLYPVLCLMFWCFHALMCPLSVSYVLPSVCQCSQPCIPLVISPVGPPHLFLVLSSVSVYLVSVFPSLPVRSLYVCLLYGFDLNFALFPLHFVSLFSCYFVLSSLFCLFWVLPSALK